MNYLAIHLLRSLPVNCVNRDDINEPKTAIFGGKSRLRISSQCFGHWLRKAFKTNPKIAKFFGGKRSKHIPKLITETLKRLNTEETFTEEEIPVIVEALSSYLGKFNKEENTLEALVFTSDQEIDVLCQTILDQKKELKEELLVETSKKKTKGKKKEAEDSTTEETQEAETGKQLSQKAANAVKKNLEKLRFENSADIALFGRMMASKPELNVDSSLVRNHWITTHEAKPNDDFYTAIDDIPVEGVTGSAMMDNVLFGSGTFYGYLALNLDQFYSALGELTPEEKTVIIEEFIRTCVTCTPQAKKNSLNADTPIEYALAIVGEGSPTQLVNAFEKPIAANSGGYISPSIQAMETKLNTIKEKGFSKIEENCTFRTGVAETEGQKQTITLDEFCKKAAQTAHNTQKQE